MYRLNRRVFLGSGLALAGGAAWGGSYADAHLKLRPSRTLNTLPLDYNGFSVETAQLADPSYYDEGNTSCIALHRRLSPRGVLRLGGNTSEFCWWKTSADAQPPQIKSLGQGRDDNFMPQRFTAIAPRAVDNLRGFLDASGWTCIYGLNFGTGSPERDAEEAAYVAKALGPKLLYFQIGNEPDFYKDPNNLLRPPGWDFPDYLNEWVAIADAVVRRVPNAKFGGPDVGFADGNVEEHETDVFDMGTGRQNFDDGANCDFSGLGNRIAEGSGRYRREGQGPYGVIVGGADGFTIATG